MNLTFIFASLIFAMTPGLSTMYILNNSTIYGRKEGILSAFGVMTGGMIYNIVAAVGLAAVITNFPFLFNSIKIIGAVYLIYVGIMSFKSSSATKQKNENKQCFTKGIITNIANPKVLIFFITFIPQFVTTSNNGIGKEIFILGTIYLFIECFWYVSLATFTAMFTDKFQNFFQTKMKYISGSVFILMGLNLLSFIVTYIA
ncbi:LysE family translocator [Cetobacterium sp. 2A]|uniref:LysE family translocator n=1 Tax=unclassified Cetobacterium TaxID=2630983 RepID=UPI00163BAE74|nr:LysE family translocator [Cetobacterium sp. 2A]MBC2857166.1 LysE family translocator [Cetobacterium sp. 2A]